MGRALGDPGLKPTVRVGEAALREVAAFLLDHDGFAKASCHPKFAPISLPTFVHSMSVRVFIANVPLFYASLRSWFIESRARLTPEIRRTWGMGSIHHIDICDNTGSADGAGHSDASNLPRCGARRAGGQTRYAAVDAYGPPRRQRRRSRQQHRLRGVQQHRGRRVAVGGRGKRAGRTAGKVRVSPGTAPHDSTGAPYT